LLVAFGQGFGVSYVASLQDMLWLLLFIIPNTVPKMLNMKIFFKTLDFKVFAHNLKNL
jgi:hypothetical protein